MELAAISPPTQANIFKYHRGLPALRASARCADSAVLREVNWTSFCGQPSHSMQSGRQQKKKQTVTQYTALECPFFHAIRCETYTAVCAAYLDAKDNICDAKPRGAAVGMISGCKARKCFATYSQPSYFLTSSTVSPSYP